MPKSIRKSIKKSVRKARKPHNSAERTDPALWERVKTRVLKSPKGGPAGKWSARKAQLAVALYKKSGGRYKGQKSSQNSLVRWTREKWGYINDTDKETRKKTSRKKSSPRSGRYRKAQSPRSGRYLPLRVRQHLTPAEKRRENRKKGTKQGQHIPYSESVLKKFRKYRFQEKDKEDEKDDSFENMAKRLEMIERRDEQIRLYGEYLQILSDFLQKNEKDIGDNLLELLSANTIFRTVIFILNARANEMREEHFGRQTHAIKLTSFPEEWKKSARSERISKKVFKEIVNIVLEYLHFREKVSESSFNPFDEDAEAFEYKEQYHTIFENMLDLAISVYQEQDVDDEDDENEDENTLDKILLELKYQIEEN